MREPVITIREVTQVGANCHFDLAWNLVGVHQRRWQVELDVGFWMLVKSEGNEKSISIKSFSYSANQPFIQ